MLKGSTVELRALEPSDTEVLYNWENEPDTWRVSNTITPFSRFVIEQYIAGSHQDIYTTKQLRLMICDKTQRPVGCIDLFDYDPLHNRAGIGVLIAEQKDRRHGYASEALKLIMGYGFSTVHLHQIYCNIPSDNEASIKLFISNGFEITGVKKQWLRSGEKYVDELLLQRMA